VAWFPIGFALLATQRYYKTHWYLMFHSHNLLGLFVTIVTIWSSLEMYAYTDWRQKANVHCVLGLIALLLSIFVGVTGVVTAGMMQLSTKESSEWTERDKHYNIAKVHRYASWIMLILGNGVCSGGIATYFSKIGYGIYGTFAVCSSSIFLVLIAIHEWLVRKHNRRNF